MGMQVGAGDDQFPICGIVTFSRSIENPTKTHLKLNKLRWPFLAECIPLDIDRLPSDPALFLQVSAITVHLAR